MVLSRLGILDNVHAKHLSLNAADGGLLKVPVWNIVEAFQLAGETKYLSQHTSSIGGVAHALYPVFYR